MNRSVSFFCSAAFSVSVRLFLFAAGGFGAALPAGAQDSWAVTTFAGQAGSTGADNGTSAAARFNGLRGIAADAAGNIYVADTFNHTIRKLSPSGAVSTFAGAAGSAGAADGAATSARFNSPAGVAVDAGGNVYVADMLNHTIRKITADGSVSTLAGSAGSSGSSDGAGSSARFKEPVGVAVDGSGNVFVADTGNSTLRKISSGGGVTTLAGSAGQTGRADASGSEARFDNPYALAIDGSGNLYVADTFNHAIRKVSPSGDVSTLAGQLGTSGSSDGSGGAARFSGPTAIAIDASGTLYVTESANHVVRRILGGSLVQTLAGTSGADGSADGAGSAARFNAPSGVAAASSGLLYVGDTLNSTVRKLLRVQAPPSSGPSNTSTRLVNISTRSYVGTLDKVLIAGFVIRGSQPKQVLLRANGPALQATFGMAGTVSDPVMIVRTVKNVFVAENDNWSADAERIQAAAQRVGAFAWAAGSKDAALLLTLPPGGYTVEVQGKDNATGLASIEAYEADETATDSKLINISTRSEVRTGSAIQIAGFAIRGSAPKRVLIRASGPALTKHGVNGVLADPVFELKDGPGNTLSTADNWSSDETTIETTAAQVGAFAWERGSLDAALVTTLSPGNYTVQVRGKNDAVGVALIEVYEAD